jgi:hypothetical protein
VELQDAATNHVNKSTIYKNDYSGDEPEECIIEFASGAHGLVLVERPRHYKDDPYRVEFERFCLQHAERQANGRLKGGMVLTHANDENLKGVSFEKVKAWVRHARPLKLQFNGDVGDENVVRRKELERKYVQGCSEWGRRGMTNIEDRMNSKARNMRLKKEFENEQISEEEYRRQRRGFTLGSVPAERLDIPAMPKAAFRLASPKAAPASVAEPAEQDEDVWKPEKGEEVEAQFWGGQVWFDGKVTGVHMKKGNRVYDIEYRDGDTEDGVAFNLVRPTGGYTRARKARQEEWKDAQGEWLAEQTKMNEGETAAEEGEWSDEEEWAEEAAALKAAAERRKAIKEGRTTEEERWANENKAGYESKAKSGETVTEKAGGTTDFARVECEDGQIGHTKLPPGASPAAGTKLGGGAGASA